MYVVGVSIPKYILYFLKNTFTFLLVFFGKSFMCFSIARLQCFGSGLDLDWICIKSGLDLTIYQNYIFTYLKLKISLSFMDSPHGCHLQYSGL